MYLGRHNQFICQMEIQRTPPYHIPRNPHITGRIQLCRDGASSAAGADRPLTHDRGVAVADEPADEQGQRYTERWCQRISAHQRTWNSAKRQERKRGRETMSDDRKLKPAWTKDDLAVEWRYHFEERCGILTDGRRAPTPDEEALARKEADEHVKRLREGFAE